VPCAQTIGDRQLVVLVVERAADELDIELVEMEQMTRRVDNVLGRNLRGPVGRLDAGERRDLLQQTALNAFVVVAFEQRRLRIGRGRAHSVQVVEGRLSTLIDRGVEGQAVRVTGDVR